MPVRLQTLLALPLEINVPTDPALRSVWDLAELEVEANLGKAVETKDDWNRVIDRYHAIISERRHDAGVQPLIHEVPRTTAHPPVIQATTVTPLRATATAFALLVADALDRIGPVPDDAGLRLSTVPAFAAAPMMRLALDRIGLSDKKRIRYRDGSAGATWTDMPEVFIAQWVGPESAIVVKEDQAGPVHIRFIRRLSTDTVETVYRIGDVAAGDQRYFSALWDLGIRRSLGRFHRDKTPADFVTRLQERWSRKGASFVLTENQDGWIDQVLTLTERPIEEIAL